MIDNDADEDTTTQTMGKDADDHNAAADVDAATQTTR
jgi:hypothetical protein